MYSARTTPPDLTRLGITAFTAFDQEMWTAPAHMARPPIDDEVWRRAQVATGVGLCLRVVVVVVVVV